MKKVLFTMSLGLLCAIQANAQLPYGQNFEAATSSALPAGISQTSSASPGWVVTGGTPNWYFSKIPSHTKFAMVDDYNNDKANTLDRLTTPTLDLTSASAPVLYFQYFFFGAQVSSTVHESAYVQVSVDNGTTWTTIDTLTGTNPNSPAWQTVHLDLTAYNSSSTFKAGIVYSDGGSSIIGCAVDNIWIVDAALHDLSLQSVTPVPGDLGNTYYATGANATFGGTVVNLSNTAVTSFNASYSVNGGSAVTNTISASIPAFGSYTYTVPTPYTVGAMGTYNTNLWISSTGDSYAGDDSGATTIYGTAFIPAKHLTIEEGTGTWCGWCVRGIVWMDSLEELYGQDQVSLIAVHDQDPMMVSAYDSYVSSKIGGYPSVLIDRREVDDPGDLLDIYNKQHNYFGFADITLGAPTYSGNTLSVGATVKPAVDLNGDYRLVLVLTENGVHSTAGGTWDQHNYYSYQSQNVALTGQGVNYQDSTNPIPSASVYYNFVARSVTPSVTGAASVLPSAMTASSTYNATLTATMSNAWNTANMHAVVMLVRNSDGTVLNSATVQVPLGVSNVSAGINKVILFPNPANGYTSLDFSLAKSATVNVTVTDAVGRIVYTTLAAKMPAGEQKITIPTNNMANGIYNVTLSTENGNVTNRLSVVK